MVEAMKGEHSEWKDLDTKAVLERSERVGFCVRGQEVVNGGVVSQIPESLDGADVSVCGVKGFMTDEIRDFDDGKGGTERVACAAVACLEITDSPLHVHGETLETYIILGGRGKMVVGDRIVELREGTVVTLPPGVPHGACAEGDAPLKVLMTFNPGLAPKQQPAYRDEKILEPSTRKYIESR
jgi:mannose-6-phosphate isomerase-like protein (cupin superfamily)